MEGRFPVGIRFVLSNCTDPAQEEEFNRWYSQVHVPDMLGTGIVAHASRYRTLAPNPGDAHYLAIYELQAPDLAAAGRDLSQHADRWVQQGRIHPALQVVRRGMWRRLGSEFRTAKTGKARGAGLLAVLTNCADPTREQEFNAWYDNTHIPDIMATGLFHTGYRYEALDPSAWPGKFLAMYETDAPDPIAPADELVNKHRPQWVKAGRYTDLIRVGWRGVFQRI